MAEMRKPLLKNKYHEGCPGCALEQKKESINGVPYKEFFYVCVITLCTSLPISALFPFLYFMIRDLHIVKTTEDIGFYAGFVGSSFMVGRALTSLPWGIIADRYGRKPVMVIGLAAVAIFNTLFGLSTNYWMALTTRFFLGSLNGTLGPVKAYAMEVCSSEHHAVGMSLVTTAWSIGVIIGPAIGGYLAQPAEKFPNTFSQDGIFGRFPYFLPCLCISIFSFVAFISCIWLPETLHMHHDNKVQNGKTQDIETAKETLLNVKAPKESLLKNWPLMSSIILYSVFSLHDTAYAEVFSLWAESDRKYGGLSFSSGDVGGVLSITGFSIFVYQLVVYPPLERFIGVAISSRIAAALTVPLLAAYPFMTNLSGLMLTIVINLSSLLKTIFNNTINIGIIIIQNNSVSQDQRGAANGIAMTAMSTSRAIGPVVAGAIFSWAQKRQHASFFPGDQMVFFILVLVAFVGFLMTFKPFLTVPNKS